MDLDIIIHNSTHLNLNIVNQKSLQQCPPSLLPRPLQPQMITHLSHMIYAPETLRHALGIRRYINQSSLLHAKSTSLTNKPRQSKRTILKRLVRIPTQNLLHLVTLRPLNHFPRLLLAAHHRPHNRQQILRLHRVIPMHPETVPEQ
jgi:hypothetical protein